jgi:hypothetical protein
MEVVLQWFDELDDLVISGLSLWQGLRRICLLLGFIAAASLHALPPLGVAVESLLGLHDAALVALAFWTLLAAVSSSAERSYRARAARA